MSKLKKISVICAVLLTLIMGIINTDIGAMVVSAEEVSNRECVEITANADTTASDEVKRVKKKTGRKKVKKHKKKKHAHKWKKVYTFQTVYDIGHIVREICKGCGIDITDMSIEEWCEHSTEHLLSGVNSGFYEKEFKIITGTHKIKKLKCYKCFCGAKRKKK